MLATLLGIVITPLVAYAVDRWGYNRTIVRSAEVIAPMLPNATARELAERAVLAANQAEVEREVKRQDEQRRKHRERMQRIEAGENVGHF